MDFPTLEQVDNYAGPELLVPRLVKEHGYTQEQAVMIFREAKRMLYLRNLSGESINPSLVVDDGWHAMLMFTRFYAEFCEFIGGFVHHNPTPPRSAAEKKQGPRELYVSTKRRYAEYFGEEAPKPYWV